MRQVRYWDDAVRMSSPLVHVGPQVCGVRTGNLRAHVQPPCINSVRMYTLARMCTPVHMSAA